MNDATTTGRKSIRFTCNTCGGTFAPVVMLDHATQVVMRTCRKCGARWQLTVATMHGFRVGGPIQRMDKADMIRVPARHAKVDA